jgi:signal transduction histidine kinase
MVALAFLVPLAGLVRELARDRALTTAERDAQLVARVVTAIEDTTGYAEALAALGIGNTLNGRPISLILADGSTTGAAVPAAEDLSIVQSGAAGSAAVPGGAAVYVPVVGTSGGVEVTVRVFVPSSELDRNVVASWVVLGLLGVALVLIGVVAADRLGRSLVKPVEDLSAAAEQLGHGDLSARVTPAGPRELVEVGTEFNRLAARVGQLLQSERETAADLSHRLRTPLTAARLDAESLPPGEDRNRLLADLDELERTVDHVIQEVRRPERQDQAEAAPLIEIVRQRAAFWEALADEQGRAAEFEAPDGDLVVAIPGTDLEASLDALLGNVFAHTPEGTGYRIAVDSRGGCAVVAIEDEGPGFPGTDVLERGRSGGQSTGLGLDIARRTAESAGGQFRIGASPAGGARVEMTLPLA